MAAQEVGKMPSKAVEADAPLMEIHKKLAIPWLPYGTLEKLMGATCNVYMSKQGKRCLGAKSDGRVMVNKAGSH